MTMKLENIMRKTLPFLLSTSLFTATSCVDKSEMLNNNQVDVCSYDPAICRPASGSTPSGEDWEKTYDSNGGIGIARGVAVDSRNNIVVVGDGYNVASTQSGFDMVAKRFDANGQEDPNWNPVINPADGTDQALDVAVDSQDNVYVVGLTTSEGNNMDWSISKYDPCGNLLWAKSVDGSGGTDVLHSVAVDSQDNVYVAGAITNEQSGIDMVVTKYDSCGEEQWSRDFDNNGGHEIASTVAVDSQDNIYVGGNGSGLVEGSGSDDQIVIKYDSSGEELWRKTTDHGKSETVSDIVIDSNDNVYVAGNSVDFDNNTSSSTFAKYDPSGNELENRVANTNTAFAVTTDAEGNVYVGGFAINSEGKKDWSLVKYDPSGDETWDRTFDVNGGNDTIRSITANSADKLYVVGGGENAVGSQTNADWVVRQISRE